MRGIEKRERSIDELRRFFSDLLGPPKEEWPASVDRRFKALNDALGYRTFYARMSSEVHGDAEETIRYFVGKLQNEKVFETMALETIMTTRLYVHYAAACLLRAGTMCASRYGMNDAIAPLRMESEAMQAELMNIVSYLDADGAIRGKGNATKPSTKL